MPVSLFAAVCFALLLVPSGWAQATPSDVLRQKFLKVIDRPRVNLAAESKVLEQGGATETLHFRYQSEASQRVPGLMMKASGASGRLPVVIVLHGTGGTKEGQAPLLRELAARGFLAVAIDGRYHGERSQAGKGSADYVAAMLRRYRTGQEYPFLYDTVWDILRLLDYLETRADVDAKRIGAVGFSKGGMELYLAAAVDQRIRAAVPCIGVQSFRWAIDNNAWQSRVGTFQAAVNEAAREAGVGVVDAAFIRRFYDRVAPGVNGEFDGDKMTPLIAPRPLLVINGDSDARTPIPGLLECVQATRAAYRRAGAEDAFQFVAQRDTAHRVNPESLVLAVDWFTRRLGASVQSSR